MITNPKIWSPEGACRPARNREERVIATERVTAERKSFVLSLCENSRGRFVRIIEERGPGHRANMIILPDCGLEDLIQALQKLRS